MIPIDAGQVIVAGFPAGPPPDELLRAARARQLGGFILFGRNIEGAAPVLELNRALHGACDPAYPPWLTLDQEGGRVARIGPPVVSLPPMDTLGRIADRELTRRAGELLGRQLRALGFNLNLAPVLDVNTNPDNPVIGDRSFGTTPQRVIAQAGALIEGMATAGMAACGKHFPGHGDTELDSHLALPRLSHARERLDAIELAPFRALAPQLPAILTAHVVFDDIEPGVPATLSHRCVTGLLREQLGFGGVVFTDDLEMGAISDNYGIEESAIRAIRAGSDALLICSDVDLVRRAHAALIGEAERDSEFATTLQRAARRSLDARKRFVADAVAPGELETLLDAPATEALQAAIAYASEQL